MGHMAVLQLWGLWDSVRKSTRHLHAQRLQAADLLFTGDGEAFNVGDPSDHTQEPYLIVSINRLDSSSRAYRHMHGQI